MRKEQSSSRNSLPLGITFIFLGRVPQIQTGWKSYRAFSPRSKGYPRLHSLDCFPIHGLGVNGAHRPTKDRTTFPYSRGFPAWRRAKVSTPGFDIQPIHPWNILWETGPPARPNLLKSAFCSANSSGRFLAKSGLTATVGEVGAGFVDSKRVIASMGARLKDDEINLDSQRV